MIAEFYKPGSSLLHRWDVRAKLLVLPALVAAFFVPSAAWVQLVFVAAIFAIIAISFGAADVAALLKSLWPILALMVLLTPAFHREGVPAVHVLGVTVLTSGGLELTIALLLRFLGIASGFYAIVRSVSLDDLVLGLRWFGLPYGGCLVVTITLRTIPTLAATWHAVRDAHLMRSGTPESRRPGVRTYVPILTSVMIEALKSIPLLAMALECRGFGRRNPRTSLAGLQAGRALLPHALGLAAAAAALLWPALVRW